MRCPVGSGALAALAVGTCIFQFGSNPCHAGDERHGREEKCQEARLDCTAVSMPRRPRSFKVRQSRRIESCLKVNLSSLHLSTRGGKRRRESVMWTGPAAREGSQHGPMQTPFTAIALYEKQNENATKGKRLQMSFHKNNNQGGSMLHPHSHHTKSSSSSVMGSC